MKQLKFFDESGFPHADTNYGMAKDKRNPSWLKLNGMVIQVDLHDKHEGALVALSVLRKLHLDVTSPWTYSDWIKDPIEYELAAGLVLIAFRSDDDDDDGVIRFSQRKKDFAMSLPDLSSWNTHGLGWIARRKCCWQEKRNPTPWFGSICHCPQPTAKRPVGRLLTS